jgi:hypothetical protein
MLGTEESFVYGIWQYIRHMIEISGEIGEHSVDDVFDRISCFCKSFRDVHDIVTKLPQWSAHAVQFLVPADAQLVSVNSQVASVTADCFEQF